MRGCADMTAEEIKKAIRKTRHELKTATGTEYVRLNEELETLTFLLISKRR